VSVAPISKEAQRAELHKTIWRIANDLRGSVDGWDFKSYVLGMLFYRFISENLTAYLNEQEREADTLTSTTPRCPTPMQSSGGVPPSRKRASTSCHRTCSPAFRSRAGTTRT
jgi:HsdM-like protein